MAVVENPNDIPEIEALRLLVEQCRHIIVQQGQSAFANVNANEARRQADRLERLEAAENALELFEETIKAFPELFETDAQSESGSREIKHQSIIPAESFGEPLFLQSNFATAKGMWDGKSFVILEGSEMRASETESIYKWLKDSRAELISSGAVAKKGTDRWVFKSQAHFPSPSWAAGVILGRSTNGPQTWRLQSGEPLGNLIPKK